MATCQPIVLSCQAASGKNIYSRKIHLAMMGMLKIDQMNQGPQMLSCL